MTSRIAPQSWSCASSCPAFLTVSRLTLFCSSVMESMTTRSNSFQCAQSHLYASKKSWYDLIVQNVTRSSFNPFFTKNARTDDIPSSVSNTNVRYFCDVAHSTDLPQPGGP